MITSIESFIPKEYERDNKLNAFISKFDSIIESIQNDIKDLSLLNDPVRMPIEFLDVLGDFLSADFLPFDTEDQKRKKIYNAVNAHRNRSLFSFDIKPKIDAITGGDCFIYLQSDSAQWVIFSPEYVLDNNWGVLGTVGDDYGLDIIGSFEEYEIAGNIAINISATVVSSSTLDLIEETIRSSIPAYYRIYLGYGTGSVFTISRVLE